MDRAIGQVKLVVDPMIPATTMKLRNALAALTLLFASMAIAMPSSADTVKARCDVYSKGEDRATSSGPCTFSQRQGAVGIQLANGKRYDLEPVGNQPGNYRDQKGRSAFRQAGLGERGQIYRLATESIYVYWDASSGSASGGNATSAKPKSFVPAKTSVSEVGTPVAILGDLVGVRAGQAENTIKQRGFRFLRADPSGDAVYGYWREAKTNNCVIIRTANGRYDSIVYGTPSCN